MDNANAQYKEKLKALNCIVIVPIYNNASTIAQVIADIKNYSEDILVVNDGSTDATSEILHSLNDLRIIEYARNKGKGYALKLALKEAYRLGFSYAITIDSDGQHYADDIPVFIDRIEEVPDSLLIGARNLTADNMPSKNTFANKFSNFWYKVETGSKLSDTQSGYRLYPLRKLQNIRFITRRYEFEVEIIVRAAWRGVNVENVPIKVYYAPAEERVSHFRPLRDFTRISILNTVLVLWAFLAYYPWRFLKSLSKENIKSFINQQIIHSKDSNIRMAAAMGWGVFCGIIPIWGYQMIVAGLTAHFMKLNKIVTLVFSNISVPPMIPFILYGSIVLGGLVVPDPINVEISDISFESIGLYLSQYIVGSILLAVLAGCVVFLSGLSMMVVFNRKREKEISE